MVVNFKLNIYETLVSKSGPQPDNCRVTEHFAAAKINKNLDETNVSR
jgi:hypothetical protein